MKPLLAALVTALVFVGHAGAQPVADHLKCYKVKDSRVKATYTADLGGLVSEPGCLIKVPGKMLCVEATKTNVNPPPPGGPDDSGPAGRFLCYKVKCPKAVLTPLSWHDQFGTGTITPSVPKMLCAPEIVATTSTTTTLGATTTAVPTTTIAAPTTTTTTLQCPTSCAQQGAQCGPASDGCGNVIQCGTCPAGQICGGGGTPNVCFMPSCTPTTCAAQGVSCGPTGDGCGNVIQCGTCPAGQICGGGGTPSVCGNGTCSPTTCAAQGVSCGPTGDGCGNVIQCGTCPAGQTCGGGGPSVCG
jgi:hypothetical protein